MRRAEVSPAALGSIGLHVAIALAFVITWGTRDLKVGAVVPVNIVSSAPDADTRPAIQGPQTQTAMTETPAPAAPDPAPPPEPAQATPAPAKPSPKPAGKALDLDALAASLTRPARNAPQKPSAAPRGPARAETAPVARSTTGSGLAAGAALQGLAEELQRRWNPNCEVEGGRNVVVTVTFQLGVGGQVVGQAATRIEGGASTVAQVGADRAVRAVYQTAPFRNLPREYYGERIAVTFDARQACQYR